jgi:hypothetical protein
MGCIIFCSLVSAWCADKTPARLQVLTRCEARKISTLAPSSTSQLVDVLCSLLCAVVSPAQSYRRRVTKVGSEVNVLLAQRGEWSDGVSGTGGVNGTDGR